jgi:hypothetical protein
MEDVVDPIMMAAATAAGLFAKKMLEEAGSQAGKALSTATSRLVAWLRRHGDEDPETGAALIMVQAEPADPARVELLGQVLAARAEADPELARQLRQLVGEADRAGDIHVTIGGAHLHGSVSGHTRVNQAGRDQIHLEFNDRL